MGEWAGISCMPVWDPDGDWEMAYEWSVRDARAVTRGEARRDSAWDIGFCEARIWKRHIRVLLLGEQWEHHCDDEGWVEDDPDGPDGAEREMPDDPPEGWEPHEGIPVWTFCHCTDPGAVPAWVVAKRGDRPPERPQPANDVLRAYLLAAASPVGEGADAR